MSWRVLTWFRRWRYWRRWQMSVPDPPPPAGLPGQPVRIMDVHLPDPATADPPESPPVRTDPVRPSVPVPNFGGFVKRSMTKKSRSDLSAAMLHMCALTGWRDTTLNPDLSNDAKIAIIANRFGKVAGTDDDSALYGELMALAAVTVGAAQGIARRDARDRKRRSRAARKAQRKARKEKGGKGG